MQISVRKLQPSAAAVVVVASDGGDGSIDCGGGDSVQFKMS